MREAGIGRSDRRFGCAANALGPRLRGMTSLDQAVRQLVDVVLGAGSAGRALSRPCSTAAIIPSAQRPSLMWTSIAAIASPQVSGGPIEAIALSATILRAVPASMEQHQRRAGAARADAAVLQVPTMKPIIRQRRVGVRAFTSALDLGARAQRRLSGRAARGGESGAKPWPWWRFEYRSVSMCSSLLPVPDEAGGSAGRNSAGTRCANATNILIQRAGTRAVCSTERLRRIDLARSAFAGWHAAVTGRMSEVRAGAAAQHTSQKPSPTDRLLAHRPGRWRRRRAGRDRPSSRRSARTAGRAGRAAQRRRAASAPASASRAMATTTAA